MQSLEVLPYLIWVPKCILNNSEYNRSSHSFGLEFFKRHILNIYHICRLYIVAGQVESSVFIVLGILWFAKRRLLTVL